MFPIRSTLAIIVAAVTLNGDAEDLRFGVVSDLHMDSKSRNVVEDSIGRHDASESLVSSALASLSKRTNLLFILAPGDFMPHRDLSSNETVAIEQEVSKLFATNFDRVPIFPVLGNNDSDNHDYHKPSQGFLKAFADIWAPLVGGTNREVSNRFVHEFEMNGYYDVDLPGLPVHLMGLSPFFISNDKRSSATDKEATNQLDRLGVVARQYSTNKVWVLCHIPPGLDAFQLLGPHPHRDRTLLWEPANQSIFLDIVRGHRNVTVSFCGHTHEDELRLISGSASDDASAVLKSPIHIVHVAPSVSPDHGNYPAYQIYSVNSNGEITGYTTWRTTNGSCWEKEYSFTNAPISNYACGLKPDFAKHYAVGSLDPGNEWIESSVESFWKQVIPIMGK